MRASLYFADETYHAFSSYFHVIHCIATIETSLTAITHLLLPNTLTHLFAYAKFQQ